MSRWHILYLPLTEKETRWGFILGCVYFACSLILSSALPLGSPVPTFILALVFFAVLLFFMRRFWQQTWRNIPFSGWQLLWKPFAAVAASRLVCIAANDILLLYGVPYFVATSWGPMLWDIRAAVTAAAFQSQPFLTVLTVLVLFPVVEEFLFRGVIFGSLYSKSAFLAVILSVLAYAVFRTVPYLGHIDDPVYLVVYFAQHIPAGLLLCWTYASTNSILAPIGAHIMYNIILLCTTY